MAQADRVLSTPHTNMPTSQDRSESALGAVQLSPPPLIPTSPPAACQAFPVDPEPQAGSRIQSGGASNSNSLPWKLRCSPQLIFLPTSILLSISPPRHALTRG